MSFHINKVILWIKNGNIRELDFKPNKVNIITGGSNTGKSVILGIIDYCFFASRPKIPEAIINENIEWYGINFNINNKCYTIGRKSLKPSGEVSDVFYFSSVGEQPSRLISNISKKELKKIIEKEMSIDDNVVIPYGGRSIRQGSKISLRYFLLFNTQSEDVIINTTTFFDKQNKSRYKEALERIFDLAIGIDTVEDTLIRDKINQLEKKLNKWNKKKRAYEQENMLFEEEMVEIIQQAKEYKLISDLSTDLNENIKEIKSIINLNMENEGELKLNKLEKLKEERLELKQKIRNLNKFKEEYKKYNRMMKKNRDSLKPINYIEDNYMELIEQDIFKDLILHLKEQFNAICSEIKNSSPINVDVNHYIKNIKEKLKKLEKEIAKYPKENKKFDNIKRKYIFLGATKNKIETYEKEWDEENYDEFINEIKSDIKELEEKLGDRDSKKEATIRLLEEFINIYLKKSADALENYAEYKAAFNYKEKRLCLQKPESIQVANIVGSSSNHLFLHLTMFLGLHELIISQNIPFVLPFLFLDQPSRPYYDNKREKAKDKEKITIAIKLLNDFITRINEKYEKSFQFIVLEHIPKEIWEDNNMQNVYLSKEFFEEKLIREKDKIVK